MDRIVNRATVSGGMSETLTVLAPLAPSEGCLGAEVGIGSSEPVGDLDVVELSTECPDHVADVSADAA